MDLLSYFATLGEKFRGHYLDLAERAQTYTAPAQQSIEQPAKATAVEKPTEPKDTYEPSTEAAEKSTTWRARRRRLPATNAVETKPIDTITPSDESDEAAKADSEAIAATAAEPAPTYSFERSASLKWGLNLQFNLAAMTGAIESIANGEVEDVEEFARAGFGLSADLKFRGSQTISTDDPALAGEGDMRIRASQISRSRSKMVAAFRSRNFQADAFYRDSEQVRRTLDVKVQDGHRRATNKLALRYRMDTGFNMSFLNRFNVQTQSVADAAPDAVEGYVTSAGNVAEKGTPEMMASFFDAVDGYLDQAEEQLIAKATEFFNMAAEELGFSGEMVDMARDQLVGSIESFFERVDGAVAMLESNFVPSEAVQPLMPVGEPEILSPEVAEDTEQLAVA